MTSPCAAVGGGRSSAPSRAFALAFASTASATLPPPVKGVNYGPMPSEVLTIFPTASSGAFALRTTIAGLAPTVILVHGGGWRTQYNETEQPSVAQGLRSKGYLVYDINYPQDNGDRTAFPTQPEALQAAIAFAHESAASFGGDPENIVLVGGSAGGHLVDLAGEQQLPGVRAVVSLSGPTNLITLMALAKHQELKLSLAVSLAQALGCGEEFLGYEKIQHCTPEAVALAQQFSPVNNIPATSCPNWLLFSAQEDLVPVSQQREFLSLLRAAGCNASLTVAPGAGHAFGYWSTVNTAVYQFIAAN